VCANGGLSNKVKEDRILKKPTLRGGIELAVTTEKLGASFYTTMAKRFKENPEINELFSILAKDEEAHEAQFRALLGKVPADEKNPGSEEQYEYLAAAAMSQFFSTEQGPMKDVEKIQTRDDAFARAFALEKATLLYYHAMQDILGENEILEAIISAEKSHLVSVMKYMITNAKMRGLSDTW
jgi:rubrerythrin